MSAFTPEQRRELADLLRAITGGGRQIEEWAKEAPAPPAGEYIECDCDCGTKCPQGRVGSQDKCRIWKKPPTPPAGDLVTELKGWTTGSEATDDACRMVWLMHKAAAEIERLTTENEKHEALAETYLREKETAEARVAELEAIPGFSALLDGSGVVVPREPNDAIACSLMACALTDSGLVDEAAERWRDLLAASPFAGKKD